MMQRYAEYKDSGVDWLGEIPAGWEVKRAKFLLEDINNRSITGEEELLSLSKDQGVIPKRTLADRAGQANTLVGYKIVKDGDLVINKMQAANGLISVSSIDGITSPDYGIYRAKSDEVDISYIGLALKLPIYLSEIRRRVTGVMEGFIRLYTDDLFEIPFVFPPLPEQTAIAGFLDDKVGKIEALVGIKRRQIELLAERKQILIQNAVTKGLNPAARMKDSGVDWIGEIPAHWEVKRLKFLCSIGTGERNTEDKVEGGKYPFFVRSQTAERINSYSYDGEAILTAGDGAGVGKVYHYVSGKFDFHQRVYKFSDFSKLSGKYLFHYISRTFYSVAMLGTAKSTVDSLRLPLIQNFWVPFPSESVEQREIVEHIDRQSKKIDAAITIKQNQITKLNEYKTTLINAAVTGKIKVV